MTGMTPMVIFLYLYFPTEILINDFFDQKVSKIFLLKVIGFAYIPMLIEQYFLWYNLLTYWGNQNIIEGKDFLLTSFAFGFSIKDLEFINTVCWGIIYLVTIICLIIKDVNVIAVIVSVLLPSALFFLIYHYVLI